MDDGRGQKNILNLLHLNLPIPSSSSSPPPASVVLSSAGGGGIFNYPAAHPITMNNPTSYNINMGAAPEICPASQVEVTHSILLNSNLQLEHVGLVGDGGRMSRRKTTRTRTRTDGCMNNGPVIHVRAKRGQATDSHSLAERVRREKINDKLKALQHLVPGCYKTMGMAVMLDVIINYVQSLQNQIEFLSMKLSAASMFYDFNSPEAEAMEAFQMYGKELQRTNSNPCEEEAREMERMMMIREDEQGFDPLHLASSSTSAPAHLHPTWPF